MLCLCKDDLSCVSAVAGLMLDPCGVDTWSPHVLWLGWGSSPLSGEDVRLESAGEARRLLEMVALWLCHTIRLSSSAVDPVLYELLPYMCQYIGTESDQGVSQACLQALSYLSVCILPTPALAPCLHMVQRCVNSTSYKTKLSTLEFLQTVVFTNLQTLHAISGLQASVLGGAVNIRK